MGRKALAGLSKMGIKPLSFVDSNPDLWNTSVDGLKVLSPSDAVHSYGNTAAFVVTIWSPGVNFLSLQRQLHNMGCPCVISFVYLFQKYPDIFLPHVCIDLPHKIFSQSDEIRKAMSILADHTSRMEFLNQLKWLSDPIDMGGGKFQPSISGPKDLPTNLFSLHAEEIFVDCGAFNGDTIRSLLDYAGSSFRAILAFEPDPQNFACLESFVASLQSNARKNIFLHQAAIGAVSDVMQFSALGSVGSFLDPSGSIQVEVKPLDAIFGDDFQPTIIKMDIEGAEIDGLIGGTKIIGRSQPVLSIYVYHCQDHLWRIPLLIHSQSKEYQLFLRRYTNEFSELVCFAIPVNRLRGKNGTA